MSTETSVPFRPASAEEIARLLSARDDETACASGRSRAPALLVSASETRLPDDPTS